MSNTPNPNPNPNNSTAPGNYTAANPLPIGGASSAEISNSQIRTILTGLDDIRLKQVQGILKAKGWYGSSERGNGFMPQDINAFQNFYETAKAKGLDWQTALTQVAKGPDFVMGSSGINKVPSAIDLKEVLQRTALTVMGRTLDDNAVQNLVGSYQSVANGTASTQAPAADTFFKSRIEQKYGAESDATKYLSAISNVSKVLGNL
jgi:hypothetical protein